MAIRPGSTTVLTGLGTSPKAARLSTTGDQVRRINATTAQVQDPAELARLLNDLSGSIHDATLSARSQPFAGGSLVAGIVSPGGLVSVNHNLGRQYVGYLVVRAQGASWNGFEPNPQPATIDPKRTVQLNIANAGTYALWFF